MSVWKKATSDFRLKPIIIRIVINSHFDAVKKSISTCNITMPVETVYIIDFPKIGHSFLLILIFWILIILMSPSEFPEISFKILRCHLLLLHLVLVADILVVMVGFVIVLLIFLLFLWMISVRNAHLIFIFSII